MWQLMKRIRPLAPGAHVIFISWTAVAAWIFVIEKKSASLYLLMNQHRVERVQMKSVAQGAERGRVMLRSLGFRSELH